MSNSSSKLISPNDVSSEKAFMLTFALFIPVAGVSNSFMSYHSLPSNEK